MSYLLSTLGLAPVLLAEAAWLRLTIKKLPEPPGPRNGEAGAGPPMRLLLVGDSAAAGVGATHQDEALLGQLVLRLTDDFRVNWELHARAGDSTADALDRLERMPAASFDVAVTSLGVNDVVGMVRVKDWLDRQAALRSLLRRRFGVRLSVISGLPPVHEFPALPQPLRWHLGTRATQFDHVLRADIHRDASVCFVSLRFAADPSLIAADGLHPGPGIYAEWADRVAGVIRGAWR